ncbi:MAG TPA: hypothetical protein PKK43_07255, partial [Spirochaetota bacterium]|nr:hypothetical protein [Spirochaetota bacterium]
MAIHDIIRRNEDRLFIVDTECFIIFTGDSITDRKPFIRIGNWLDLPAEIIPLVENIIITDSLAGNPAHEQFNIDIKYLPTNRYIGSSHVVKRFLEFQSYFGLDLHNASIIDADRDIPDISKKSAVSDNDDFIGVFYRNGNFKVTHRGSDLFDLHEYHDSPSSDKGAHERLAALSKTRRYAGSGFVVVEHNPIFYRANSFTSYLFPHTYFPSFFTLGINPRSIASVIHPTENYLGISRYLKWRNASGGKITIFTDHNENPSMLLNLFPGVKITLAPFTGMRAETSPGISFSQVSHSFNVIGELITAGSGKSLRFAYMKGISELKKIAKEKLDLVFMNYSVFEDSSYLSKSFRAPVLLVDDGNPSVRKVPALDNPVIRNDIQYEVDCCETQEIPLRVMEYLPSDISGRIVEESFLESLIPAPGKELTPDECARLFNTLSYLRHIYLNTQDRKLSSLAKKVLREGYAHHSRDTVYGLGDKYRIDLLVTNGAVYEFARTLSDPPPEERYLLDYAHIHRAIELTDLSDAAERELYRRITDDRNRLSALLELFLANPEYRREVAALKKAIEERKKLFAHEHTRHMHHKPGKSSGFIDTLRASIGTDASGSHISSRSEGRASSNAGGFAGKILRAIGLSAGSADDSSVMSRRNPSTSGNAHSPVRGLSALLKKITGNGRSGDASLSGKRAKNEKDKSSGEIHQSSSAAGSARRGASD